MTFAQKSDKICTKMNVNVGKVVFKVNYSFDVTLKVNRFASTFNVLKNQIEQTQYHSTATKTSRKSPRCKASFKRTVDKGFPSLFPHCTPLVHVFFIFGGLATGVLAPTGVCLS